MSECLPVLLLRKRLNDAKKALESLRAKDTEFETRNAEIAGSIEAAETEEEKAAVEEAVTAYETEKAAHEESKGDLERKIAQIEEEIAEEERSQNTDPEPEPAKPEKEKREKEVMIDYRNSNRVAEMVKREDVQAFLKETRDAIRQKRAIVGVGLLIPEIMLGLLRENIMEYSKLYKHVFVRPVGGDARQPVQGTVAEAVWTDCCANLNELDLDFADLELACWRVGGFYSICNAELEDSDINLMQVLLSALGQAIGMAVDKAILYGLGTRMPLGVVTRLAQTSKPAGYPDTARTWADLHTSNIKTIANTYTGKDLFAQIVLDAAAAKGKYSRGRKVWVVNEYTYSKLVANALAFDASGAIVSSVNGTMPVLGGVLEVLDFVPDNVIVGGFFDLYTLAERGGTRFASSEHVKFLQDKTVMKGTARYDGAPAIAEAFVAIGIDGTTPDASMTFAGDTANEVNGIMINTATATVASGSTITLLAKTYPGEGTITWESATTAKATVSSSGVVTGVAAGSSVITASSNGMTASCTVTVTT